jgi:electron transfer flavoprotein alpha subunit
VANIVVFIEMREGRPTEPSRFALGEARRVAEALGASVYALVPSGELSAAATDALPGALGAAGADKILLCADAALSGPPVDAVMGGLLAVVAEKLRPRLFVWPAGSVGLQLAPSLAARTGAALFPRASLVLVEGAEGAASRLELRRWSSRQDGIWTLDLGATGAAAVVTLAADLAVAMSEPGEAELQMLSVPAAAPDAPPMVEELDSEADAHAPLELASILIVCARAERDRVAAAIDHRAGLHGAVVVADLPAGGLRDACPHLVLVLGGKPLPAGLAELQVAPGAHVVALGSKRTPPPLPVVDGLWQVPRTRMLAALAEAVSTLPARPPAEPPA